MGLKIEKTASYLPKKEFTNFDFEKIIDTSNDWILTRTGIYSRHYVEDENLEDIVLKSVENLLATREDLAKVKVILVSTCTSKYQVPSLASRVQEKFFPENKDVFALDINMACSGFVSSMEIMDKLLEDGDYGLLIGGEVFSNILDFKDRNTAILFGDGSGASLVSKTLEDSFFKTGSLGDSQALNYREKLFMDGKKVYKFAIETIPEEINKFLKDNNLRIQDIDFFISHQANIRIINSIAKKIKIKEDKFPTNLKYTGNLSSASIPVLLDELNKNEEIERGDKLLFISFGAGLAWSLAYIEW